MDADEKLIAPRLGTILAIAVWPGLTVAAAELLLRWGGKAFPPFASPQLFNGHAEAAARVTLLATVMAVTALGIAAILYFIGHVRRFDRRSGKTLAIVAGAAALVGIGFVVADMPRHAQVYLGKDAVRFALRQAETDCRVAPAPSAAFVAFKPGPLRETCEERLYAKLERLNGLQRVFIAIVSGALVFGTIACLGVPATANPARTREQAARLQTYLYLSAAVLVAGLAYLSALLRWPGYGIVDKAAAASFRAHADALVLFWGVTYSVFIALYYVPVARILGRRLADHGVPEKDIHAAVLGPIPMIKTIAAIAAPTIAALISSLKFT